MNINETRLYQMALNAIMT